MRRWWLALAVLAWPWVAQAQGPCARPGQAGRAVVVDSATVGPEGRLAVPLRDREVLLTFDDGPDWANTPAVLDILAAFCAPAVFFPVGPAAEAAPELLRRIAAAGHVVGTHTYGHPALPALPPADAAAEVQRGIVAVARGLGRPPAPLFRFPFLADTPELIAWVRAQRLHVLGADAHGEDWNRPGCLAVVERVMGMIRPLGRGVILLHDYLPDAPCSTRELLRVLREEGYQPVRLVVRG